MDGIVYDSSIINTTQAIIMMGLRIDQNTEYTLLSPEEANRLVINLNSEEQENQDGWCYKANHDLSGKGRSFIEVYDDKGYFLGKL